MSIILNKDIYDEAQGNPLQPIMDYLELLDKEIIKIKKSMSGLEGMLNLGMDNTNAKEYLTTISKLQSEVDKLTTALDERKKAENQLADAQRKLNALQDESTRNLIETKAQTQALTRQIREQALLENTSIDSKRRLRIELKQLNDIILRSAEGSEEYNRALRRAAEITDHLSDTQARIKGTAMDFEGVMGNVVKVTQGVGDMFQIATGAQALFGIESQDLMKTLVKLQALMAITQGLQGLDGLGKSFMNLLTQIKFFAQGVNKALLATGIGAIVVALGTVIAYWDEIKASVGDVSKELADNYEIEKLSLESSKKKLDALNNQDNVLKLQGKTQRQILEMKAKEIQGVIKAAEINLQTTIDYYNAKVKGEEGYQKIVKETLKWTTGGLELVLRAADAVGKLLGKDWNLTERFNTWASSFLFDPEETAKKGREEVEAAKKNLDDLNNEYAGFLLEIKALDNKAAEDKKQKDEENFKQNQDLIKAAEEKRKLQSDLEAEAYRIEDESLQASADLKEQYRQAEWDAAIADAEAKQELRDEELKREQEYLEQRNALIAQSLDQSGQMFGEMLAKGELTYKEFGKFILTTAVDIAEKMILLAIAELTANEIARKSFAGIATAALLAGIIKGVFAGIKANIRGFATGTDRITGSGTETSDSIPAMLSKNEGVIPASINKQLLGLGTGATDKNLPYLVAKGMNSIYVEAALQRIDDNTAKSAWFMSNMGNHWVENGKHYYKDIKTGQIHIMPEA